VLRRVLWGNLWILDRVIDPLIRIEWLGVLREIVLLILVVVGVGCVWRFGRSKRLGRKGLHGLSVWGFLVMLIAIERVYEALRVAG
jgi:hypothetical protein